jgi:ABC-type glycerol-3-phosphate transport system substrate-binding protein
MVGFEFSTINSNLTSQARSLLDEQAANFNRSHPASPVTINNLVWADAWQQLMRSALYKNGPTLSEIGAPWTSDFVSMNSLRPFEADEIERLGSSAAFPTSAWTNCLAGRKGQVWSVPARIDMVVVFYWKDMLGAARVDPETAFNTAQNFVATLERLQAAGIKKPLSMVTSLSRAGVYRAATWIWGAGGEIIDPDGRLAILEPAAQAGLRAYFNLHRFIAPGQPTMFDDFLNRRSAVIVHGYDVLTRFRAGQGLPWSAALEAQIGAALPPGPSFVGGSNLVIWRHADPDNTAAALTFIEEWTRSPAMLNYCRLSDMLPAREELLADLAAEDDSRVQVLIAALRGGRTHASAQTWIPVAERLGGALGWVWSELNKDPAKDIGELVSHATELAVERLDHSLL